VKVLGITQARIGSSRLPKKILLNVKDKTLLEYHLQRIVQSKAVTQWVVATTTEADSGLITSIANELKIQSYQGDLNHVLKRFYEAAKPLNPDYIVRVTSDCPLADPELIDDLVHYTIGHNLDYCRTSDHYADGVDVEVFTFNALENAFFNATLLSDTEHVTPFIRRSVNDSNVYPCSEDYKDIRFTVDEMSDFETVRILIETLGESLNWKSYANYIKGNPTLFANQAIIRNEGYLKSKLNDQKNK
jgi:spore coat polysaccharide biosynthesis protein SpsF (cytidylyltransferase family)